MAAVAAGAGHSSGQPQSFSSLRLNETNQRIPQKVLMTSRNVEECKPLDSGGGGGSGSGSFSVSGGGAGWDIPIAIPGRVVHVGPIKLASKAPGTIRLNA